MIVAVLGAGNGGQAMAAELAMGGHRVRLYEHPQFEPAIAPLLTEPEIELVGDIVSGRARLEIVTTDIARAVTGAEMIVSPYLGVHAMSPDELRAFVARAVT